ncbi:DEAD/DEAH box helicase [Halobacteriovorax sp. GB3]|uniref:DEAD/DEAH box helicase n=1 Tax=Halobacteriovorax sp. GB3 TaxID=2719615 RepID=UPI0023629A0D|nr:DEAD/DEAH box helicase [Halobacteriovorax sp. GB3]MDD0852184.1 DEAD/DEAH box helicase [Halobacteriovorax sp. GB3]
MATFEELGLSESIVKALVNKGYKIPTEVQEKSIPILLEGEDLLGLSDTGTGKTAAFSLPLIHRLSANKKKLRPYRIRSLILTPTRELADQVEQQIKLYAKGNALRVLAVYGGSRIKDQKEYLMKGVDVLVATPGRLKELFDKESLFFEEVEYLVLDEVDKMLDMGFYPDVKEILSHMPKERQNVFYSATLPKEIEELVTLELKEPKKIEVAPVDDSDDQSNLQEYIFQVHRANKPLLLTSLLKKHALKSAIIFVRTKKTCDRVTKMLREDGHSVMAFHGGKNQGQRMHALKLFKKKKLKAIVATDVASRGIDVDDVTHVINYQLPEDSESYIHRVGRTARAGKKGVAITFCDDLEVDQMKDIENEIGRKIEIDSNHPYHGKEADFKSQKK